MATNEKNESNSDGFTLIELLVTLVIAGVVAVLGIPSFTETIKSSRLTTHANELVTAVNLARSEAIKRGVQVTIRRATAQWEGGWNVFVDSDLSTTFNDDGDTTLCENTPEGLPAEDCLLKTYAALSTNYTLRTGVTTYQNFIAYAPTGLSVNSPAVDTFRLCDTTADTTTSRAIIFNTVGRARVSTGTASCP